MPGLQINILDPNMLSSHLTTRGISHGGAQSIRDNGITGEMLVEFCEEDIHDAFSVFKDRFIIRKMIREHKSQSGIHDKQLSQTSLSCKKQRDTAIKPQTIAPSRNTMHSVSPSRVSHACANVNVGYSKVPSKNQLQNPQHSLLFNQSRKEHPRMPTSPEIKLETNSRPGYSYPAGSGASHSSQPEVQAFPPPVRSPLMHHVVSSSVEDRLSGVRSETGPGPGGESVQTVPQNQIVRCPNVNITVEEKQRIKRYNADELLDKKCIRSKPNEAQHLGSLAIRNAAQSAQIWDNPPVMREISEAKKDLFVKSLLAFAPQLSERMDTVWIRLREALQNRRKYLLDKESGKRQTKLQRTSPYEKKNESRPTLMKVKEPRTLIDLTD